MVTSSEHHITCDIPDWLVDKCVQRDKDERQRARSKGWKTVLDHPEHLEWGGYVFEEVFGMTFKKLTPISRKYGMDLKDFKSETSNLRFELKCRVTDYAAFQDNFNCYVNQSQLDKSEADIFVFGYYYVVSGIMRICGWLGFNEIPEIGQKHEKGSTLYGDREVLADCFSIKYYDLHPISTLPY